jgi:integrase/recombinase XerD
MSAGFSLGCGGVVARHGGGEQSGPGPACPALKAKRISPDVIHHATAMHVLPSGVEIAVIALWLGQTDLKIKEQAIGKLQPVDGGFPRFKPDDALPAFLSAL